MLLEGAVLQAQDAYGNAVPEAGIPVRLGLVWDPDSEVHVNSEVAPLIRKKYRKIVFPLCSVNHILSQWRKRPTVRWASVAAGT